jgi:hypothetical protein
LKHLKLIFCVTSLSLSLTSISSDHCHDLNSVVCSSSLEQELELQEKISILKKKIKIKAENRAAKQIRDLKIKGPLKIFTRYFRSEVILNTEIIKAAHEEIEHFEEDLVSQPLISKVKQLLKDEITKTEFSGVTKSSMISKINQVRVFTFLDYMNHVGISDRYLPSLFRAHCGMDGLSVNAFATTVGDLPMVLICPGFLINVNLMKNFSELISRTTMVLSHEISHHIDSADYPNAYKKYHTCFTKNYGKVLNIKPGQKCFETKEPCLADFEKKQEETFNKCAKKRENCRALFCKTSEKGCRYFGLYFPKKRLKKCIENKVGTPCYSKVAKNHLGEIVADAYSAKVLSALYKEFNYSKDEILISLSRNVNPLCGITVDEGIHPTTDFRLNELFGKNKSLRSLLSCNDLQSKQVSCHF